MSAEGGDSPGSRGPWRGYREALDRAGFHPSRRLGQNFLLDENVVRAIVRDSGVGPGERVLEVGAGVGFLTRALLDAGAEVVAVELDRRLFEIVEGLLGEHPGLTLVRADALAGKHELASEVARELPAEGTWHVVSNLPYQVSGPLLAVLEALPAPPRTMTVLVQREVAERIAAEPGTRAFGALSARLQASYDARIVRSVPPQLFWPRPKVESAVVRLERRADAPAAPERAALAALLRGIFPRRRQLLRRVVGELAGGRGEAARILERAGLDPARRVESLDVAELRALARSVRRGPGERWGS